MWGNHFSNSFQKPSIAFEKLSSFGAYPDAPQRRQEATKYIFLLTYMICTTSCLCLEQSRPRSRHSPAPLLAYTSRRQKCLPLPQSTLCQIHVDIGSAFVALATIDRAIDCRSIGRVVQVESDYRDSTSLLHVFGDPYHGTRSQALVTSLSDLHSMRKSLIHSLSTAPSTFPPPLPSQPARLLKPPRPLSTPSRPPPVPLSSPPALFFSPD